MRPTLIALLAVSLFALGCSDSGQSTITVKLSEFKIELSSSVAKTGDVVFNVQNTGVLLHELALLKTDLAPDKLPVLPDGSVDEDKLELMDEIEDIEPTKSPTMTVNLKPGNYVLICNVAGHHAAKMYIGLTVR
ncbi:MAG: hypothetical protein AABM32_00965 [Chloroflexota bacterium]